MKLYLIKGHVTKSAKQNKAEQSRTKQDRAGQRLNEGESVCICESHPDEGGVHGLRRTVNGAER